MIQALLKGKEEQSLYSEDCLTSIVFERLEYFDNGRLIGKFLGKADYKDKISGDIQTLSDYIKKKEKIDILEFSSAKVFYWPRHLHEGEPDLAIILYDENYDDGILFIVEAKFLHLKSRADNNDQLASYYRASHTSRDRFLDLGLRNFKGIAGPLIYLTRYQAWDEIYDLEKWIGQKLTVFSLQWQMLWKMLNELPHHRITDDLINYLYELGLYSFTGFSVPTQLLTNNQLKWFEPTYFQFKVTSSYKSFYTI